MRRGGRAETATPTPMRRITLGLAPTTVSIPRAPYASRGRYAYTETAPGTAGRPGCRAHRASARAGTSVGATPRCGRSDGAGERPPGSCCRSRGLCRRSCRRA
eukprot:scaffold41804_cov63-Phaeocystis_antarctica.AAC.1